MSFRINSRYELSNRYNLLANKLTPFALDSLELEDDLDPLLDLDPSSDSSRRTNFGKFK